MEDGPNGVNGVRSAINHVVVVGRSNDIEDVTILFLNSMGQSAKEIIFKQKNVVKRNAYVSEITI